MMETRPNIIKSIIKLNHDNSLTTNPISREKKRKTLFHHGYRGAATRVQAEHSNR